MTTDRLRHRYNVPSARELRTHQTPAEVMLWDALRNRRLAGLKFRRQHPVGPFILDFCCPELRLAIELDGAVHTTQREHDAEREELLSAAGYTILRFPNEAIQHDLPAVLETIRNAAHEPVPPSQRVARTTGW